MPDENDDVEKQDAPTGGEIGVTGLEEFSGQIDEEKLPQLRGDKAPRAYRQMADNDATVGAILFAVENLIRNAKWPVIPASDATVDKENALFVEECRDDMSHSWGDFIAEALSMLTYGWASNEIVYKIRLGPNQTDASKRSRFNDGKIGWRKLPIRAQETLDRWEFDKDGGIKGWWQMPPSGTGGTENVFLPIQKLLHFRTTSRKNNPEGRSILRNGWISWYRKKEIERIESIGIERDLAGLPVIWLPPKLLSPDADAATKAILEAYKKIGRNVRNDEQGSLVFPSIYDDNGNKLVDFKLMGTGATRLIDTDKTIMRYTRNIAMSVLADVLLIGHEKVGSFALASSKTHLFAVAINIYMQIIADVMNRFGIPRLFELNAIDTETPPKFVPGDIEKEDLLEFAQAMDNLVGAGMLTPGGEEDEKEIRRKAGLPPLESQQTRPGRDGGTSNGNGPGGEAGDAT